MSRAITAGFVCLILALGVYAGLQFGLNKQTNNTLEGVIYPPGFPPDPGEAGKATLQGIDSDGDGVRDDVQRYIYATYPDDEILRQLLTLFTKRSQDILIQAAAGNESQVIELVRDQLDVNLCILDTYGEEPINYSAEILPIIHNTEHRRKSWNISEAMFSGQAYNLDRGICSKLGVLN